MFYDNCLLTSERDSSTEQVGEAAFWWQKCCDASDLHELANSGTFWQKSICAFCEQQSDHMHGGTKPSLWTHGANAEVAIKQIAAESEDAHLSQHAMTHLMWEQMGPKPGLWSWHLIPTSCRLFEQLQGRTLQLGCNSQGNTTQLIKRV